MKFSRTLRKAGWLVFGLGWIPFGVLMISLMSLPSGRYAWSELPLLTRWSLIGMGTCFLLAVILLFAPGLVNWLVNRAIIKRGVLAQATILNVSDTGQTINTRPVVNVLLEIYPPEGMPFQAETETIVSRLAIPSPGQQVHVKYDPATKAVALIGEGEG